MYIVYCQNKPKSEHIVSEYIDTFFEVSFWERICTRWRVCTNCKPYQIKKGSTYCCYCFKS